MLVIRPFLLKKHQFDVFDAEEDINHRIPQIITITYTKHTLQSTVDKVKTHVKS